MSRKSKRRAESQRKPVVVAVLAIAGGLVLVAAAVAALSGGSTRPAEIEVTGQPRLKVDKEVIDLGNVSLGRTVDASFVLTNVGDQPLVFEEVPFIEVVEGC
ncbi:MAG TPA: hypothetical protein VFI11_06820 [Anaerolineales bacterium]|nr:hypothetical protein [Anaerolineales bacterium]